MKYQVRFPRQLFVAGIILVTIKQTDSQVTYLNQDAKLQHAVAIDALTTTGITCANHMEFM